MERIWRPSSEHRRPPREGVWYRGHFIWNLLEFAFFFLQEKSSLLERASLLGAQIPVVPFWDAALWEMNKSCRNSFLKWIPNLGSNAVKFPGEIKGLYTKSSALGYCVFGSYGFACPDIGQLHCKTSLLRNIMAEGPDGVNTPTVVAWGRWKGDRCWWQWCLFLVAQWQVRMRLFLVSKYCLSKALTISPADLGILQNSQRNEVHPTVVQSEETAVWLDVVIFWPISSAVVCIGRNKNIGS